METISFFGIPVHNVSVSGTLNWISDRIRSNKISRGIPPAYVATVNVDFLANAVSLWGHDPNKERLATILRQADLVTADGMPLIWLSKLWKTPLKARVAGSDLLPAVLALAAREQWKVLVIGSDPETWSRFTAICAVSFPGLVLTPPFTGRIHASESHDQWNESEKEVIRLADHTKPDLILLALGNPKQELVWNRLKTAIQAPVIMGIGGSIDLLTGKRKRAPVWIQRIGLEWVVRMAQEPSRLGKRYLLDGFHLGFLLLQQLIGWIIVSVAGMIKGEQPVRTPAGVVSLPEQLTDQSLSLMKLPISIRREQTVFLDASLVNIWTVSGVNRLIQKVYLAGYQSVTVMNAPALLKIWLRLTHLNQQIHIPTNQLPAGTEPWMAAPAGQSY